LKIPTPNTLCNGSVLILALLDSKAILPESSGCWSGVPGAGILTACIQSGYIPQKNMEGMNMKIKSLFMAIFIACTLLVGLPVQAGDKVNVNTATVEQLQTVKGIGPKTAAAIVAYREANGSFDNIDELENVKGIGKKKLAGIEDQLSVEKSESSD